MTDSQPVFDHHFTLAEANALLPWVGKIFAEINSLLTELEQPVEAGAPEPRPIVQNGHANGYANGHAKGAATAELGAEEKQALVYALLAEVVDRGIVIQDPRRVLIDFPAWHGAQEIFLCYERADGAAIRAWHGLSAGYAGRRPIAELSA